MNDNENIFLLSPSPAKCHPLFWGFGSHLCWGQTEVGHAAPSGSGLLEEAELKAFYLLSACLKENTIKLINSFFFFFVHILKIGKKQRGFRLFFLFLILFLILVRNYKDNRLRIAALVVRVQDARRVEKRFLAQPQVLLKRASGILAVMVRIYLYWWPRAAQCLQCQPAASTSHWGCWRRRAGTISP